MLLVYRAEVQRLVSPPMTSSQRMGSPLGSRDSEEVSESFDVGESATDRGSVLLGIFSLIVGGGQPIQNCLLIPDEQTSD